EVRQRLVDLYTTREFLRSFDESIKAAPATKYSYTFQLILDLLSAYGGKNDALTPAPTHQEINQALKSDVIPKLTKPRQGKEPDSPPAKETDDYNGLNEDEIKLLDQTLAYLARHYNIPIDFKPQQPPSPEKSTVSTVFLQQQRQTLVDAMQKASEAEHLCVDRFLTCTAKCDNAADTGACISACGNC